MRPGHVVFGDLPPLPLNANETLMALDAIDAMTKDLAPETSELLQRALAEP